MRVTGPSRVYYDYEQKYGNRPTVNRYTFRTDHAYRYRYRGPMGPAGDMMHGYIVGLIMRTYSFKKKCTNQCKKIMFINVLKPRGRPTFNDTVYFISCVSRYLPIPTFGLWF